MKKWVSPRAGCHCLYLYYSAERNEHEASAAATIDEVKSEKSGEVSYIFSARVHNTTYSKHPLQAKTLNDAKMEVVEILRDRYMQASSELKQQLETYQRHIRALLSVDPELSRFTAIVPSSDPEGEESTEKEEVSV